MTPNEECDTKFGVESKFSVFFTPNLVFQNSHYALVLVGKNKCIPFMSNLYPIIFQKDTYSLKSENIMSSFRHLV